MPKPRNRVRLQNRRGATAVMIVVLMIPLIGLAALAIDVGSWEVGANELHKSADAAALAGARKLQTDRANAPNSIQAVADELAGANPAFQARPTIAPVKPMYWTPGTASTAARLEDDAWPTANAVQATVSRAAPNVFAGAMGVRPPTVVRPATAWIANLNGGVCIKPWALPYPEMYEVATGVVSEDPPLLTPTQLAALDGKSDDVRTITLIQPVDPKVLPAATDYEGNWEGFNIEGSSSNQLYQDALDPAKCAGLGAVTVDGEGTRVAATNGQPVKNFPRWTTPWMEKTCVFASATDATCRTPLGAAGVTQRVVWGTTQDAGTKVIFKTIGEIVLLCYYRGGSGETCPANKGTRTTISYPEGSIVVKILPTHFYTIQAGDVFGNVPSNSQRLILVR